MGIIKLWGYFSCNDFVAIKFKDEVLTYYRLYLKSSHAPTRYTLQCKGLMLYNAMNCYFLSIDFIQSAVDRRRKTQIKTVLGVITLCPSNGTSSPDIDCKTTWQVYRYKYLGGFTTVLLWI